jgi:hypothetical protein
MHVGPRRDDGQMRPRRWQRPGRRHLLTAELIYDTQTQDLPRGVRTLHPKERHLLFSVDEYELMLEVVSDTSAAWFCVTGQVLANGDPVPNVAVMHGDGATVRTDEDGTFKMVQAHATPCQLHVQADDWSMRVPSFDLASTARVSVA